MLFFIVVRAEENGSRLPAERIRSSSDFFHKMIRVSTSGGCRSAMSSIQTATGPLFNIRHVFRKAIAGEDDLFMCFIQRIEGVPEFSCVRFLARQN